MNTALNTIIDTSAAATIPLQPDRAAVSDRLARRAGYFYLAVCALGALPLVLQAAPAWQVFGLGFWLPGGGFLANGGWGLAGFAMSIVLFGIAFFLWFFMGAIYLMPAVWLATALIAAFQADASIQPWAPYVAALIPAVVFARRRLQARTRIRQELHRREELNKILPNAVAEIREHAVPAQQTGTRELSEEQLMALRYVYDRGLQPLDQFNGFNIIDQFRESAIRYQLNNLGFTLAIAQSHYLPNFHGYLSHAQRNILEKFTDRRVWGYWRIENFFGNLSLNPDPIGHDNIMLGGFYNANLSFYTSNTGDRRYLEPGALKFRLNKSKVFEHDMNTIAAKSRVNFLGSPFTLYPCEPTHSFSYCNLLGLTGIQINDRIFGSNYAADIVEPFRRNFENEFMDADGGIIASRNKVTGLRFQSFDAVWTRAGYCWLINGHYPDISERMWAMLREKDVRFDADGELVIDLSGWMDRLDCGNYTFTGPAPYVQLLVAAAEHGDREVADAALRGLDRHHNRSTESGVLSYTKLSTFLGGLVAMGRIMQRHDWRNLIHSGPPPETLRGPLLTDANYPDVQVARAWSDGEDLSLVLYPGAGQGRQSIGFERLRPGASYRLRGCGEETIVADENGLAKVEVDLSGRTEFHLIPTG